MDVVPTCGGVCRRGCARALLWDALDAVDTWYYFNPYFQDTDVTSFGLGRIEGRGIALRKGMVVLEIQSAS